MTARKPPIAVPVMRIPRWRALKADGVAHAYLSRNPETPALCGARNQDERYDWPRGRKCPDCAEKAAQA